MGNANTNTELIQKFSTTVLPNINVKFLITVIFFLSVLSSSGTESVTISQARQSLYLPLNSPAISSELPAPVKKRAFDELQRRNFLNIYPEETFKTYLIEIINNSHEKILIKHTDPLAQIFFIYGPEEEFFYQGRAKFFENQPIVELNLSQGERKKILVSYFQNKNATGVHIGTESAIMRNQQKSKLHDLVYLGCLLAVFIFNFSMFFSTREKIFGVYSAWIFCLFLSMATTMNYLPMLFGGGWGFVFLDKILYSLTDMAITVFTYFFLQLY